MAGNNQSNIEQSLPRPSESDSGAVALIAIAVLSVILIIASVVSIAYFDPFIIIHSVSNGLSNKSAKRGKVELHAYLKVTLIRLHKYLVFEQQYCASSTFHRQFCYLSIIILQFLNSCDDLIIANSLLLSFDLYFSR